MKARAALLIVVSLALTGCISLFPKTEPATLYKLSATTGAPPANAGTGPVILRAPTAFTRLGAGDRILTINGSESATIAGARWAAPASIMFDESLVRAFDATSARLVTRGDVAPADMVLRVEVRTFEARYTSGPEAAPTVVIEARASLTSMKDRVSSGVRGFQAEQPASENRVGPIVEAYNGATSKIVADIAKWAETQASAKR